MKKRYMFVLLIFLVSLLAVSAVSAADNATDDVISSNSNDVILNDDVSEDDSSSGLNEGVDDSTPDSVKNNTNISSAVNVEGYNVNLTVNVDENATGFVEFARDGNSIFAKVENGEAIFNTVFLPGNYTIAATYLGDDNFNANSTSIDFTVNEIALRETDVGVDVQIREKGAYITVTVDNDATGFVEFYFPDTEAIGEDFSLYAVIKNGQAILDTPLTPGDHVMWTTYLGDKRFNNKTEYTAFYVPDHIKKNTNISSNVSVDGYNVNLTFAVDSAATGLIQLTLGNESIFINVVNGTAEYNSILMPGIYSITTTYLGDDDFNFNTADVVFAVEETPLKNTTVVADVELFDNDVTFLVSVDENATGFVKIEIDDDSNSTLYGAVADGKAVVKTTLDAGDYKVNVTYLGDDNFNNATTTVTFTVYGHIKLDTSIASVPTIDGSTVIITTTVNEYATGFVAIEVLGQAFVVQVHDGKAVFDFDFNPGTYNANVIYMGDDNFNNASTTTSFTVINSPSQMKNTTVDVDVSNIREDVTITATVDVKASGIVEFNIGGKAVYVAVNNGKAVYTTYLPTGDYNVDVTYLGDNKYNANRTSKTFTVTNIKKDTNITSDVGIAGYDVRITVNVDLDATGFVEFTLDENSIYVKVEKGKAIFNTVLLPGNYTIAAKYLGDDEFNSNTTDISFTVFEIPLENTTMDVNLEVYENGVVATVNVDSNATGFVEFNLGGEYLPVCIAIEDGKVACNMTLDAGNYTLQITYLGDKNFNMNSTSQNFTVAGHVKKDCSLFAYATVRHSFVSICVFVDDDATGNVTFSVSNQTFILPLDKGDAMLQFDFCPGTYDVNINYLGDENFYHNSTDLSFTVENPNLKASEFTDITLNSDLNISAVLKDENGIPINNATVTYTINGVENNTTTADDGSFVIPAINGATINIAYAGNQTIRAANITMVLKIPVVPALKVATEFNISSNNTIYGYAVDTKAGEQGMTYATELLDEYGTPIGGVPIQFAVNDKIYDRITYENGSFKPYGLNMVRAGRYTLAFSFGGNDVYNSTFGVVCIDLAKKPITITASDKSFSVSTKTKQYTVKLSTIVGSSSDGNVYLSPKKVNLKVNGKTYTAKTNDNGEVTFKITNLSSRGKYTAVISYDGDNTYESASKSVKLTVS